MQTELTLHLLPLRTGAGEAPRGMGIGCRLAVVAQVQRVLRILAGCVNLARAVSSSLSQSCDEFWSFHSLGAISSHPGSLDKVVSHEQDMKGHASLCSLDVDEYPVIIR